jgi:hypothetical protein
MTRKAVVHSTTTAATLKYSEDEFKGRLHRSRLQTSLAWRGIVEGNVRYLRDFLGIRGAGLQYLNLE